MFTMKQRGIPNSMTGRQYDANPDANAPTLSVSIVGGVSGPGETAAAAIVPTPANSEPPASDGASLSHESAAIRLPVPNVSHCEQCQHDFTPRRSWGRFCSAYCRRLAWLDRNPDKAADLAERDRLRLREHVIGCGGEWRGGGDFDGV